MISARVRLLIATLWVGSLWAVGYMVAPTLFATLADKALAGTIAGKLFRIEAWLTVACSVLLIASLKWKPEELGPGGIKPILWLVVAMLGCAAIGYFGLQPFMSALREAAAGEAMDAEARSRFGLLHGIASVFYLIQSLLGGMLIWRLR